MAKDELKKCSVRIGGVVYQLVTPENETYTRQIAARADEMIQRVIQDNPQLSQAMATVLALVNTVDELSRAYQQARSMEGRQLDIEQKATEARRELNRLREQNWEMKKELLRLNELNRDYQSLINQLTKPADPETEATAVLQSPDDTSALIQPHADRDESQANDTDNVFNPDGDTQPVETTAAEQTRTAADQSAADDAKSGINDLSSQTVTTAEAETDLTQLDGSIPDDERSALSLDRMRQTNLDDYLRAFGLPDPDLDTDR